MKVFCWLLHPPFLTPSTDSLDQFGLLLPVPSYLFHFTVLSALSPAFSALNPLLISALGPHLCPPTWLKTTIPPLHIPQAPFFFLPCSPSLTPSTPFLSPPLRHPSKKTPTDGPEPSARAKFCPSLCRPALHVKRSPISVRLLSSFPSVVLLSVCLHSDSLGSLIKRLYFLSYLLNHFFLLFFLPVLPIFVLFLVFHLFAQTRLNSSLVISPSICLPLGLVSCHLITPIPPLHLSHISLLVYRLRLRLFHAVMTLV